MRLSTRARGSDSPSFFDGWDARTCVGLEPTPHWCFILCMRRAFLAGAVLVVGSGIACGGATTNVGSPSPKPVASSAMAAPDAGVAASTSHPRQTTSAHHVPRSLRVIFEGNAKVPTKDLLAALLIDKDTPQTRGVTNADVLERDVLAVTATYYDRGYLQIAVDPPSIEQTTNSLDIHIKVVEGPQFRIGKLVVEERANGKEVAPIGGKKSLRSRMTLRDGDVFARDVIVRDLQAIRKVYRDVGYANVEAEPETTLDVARAVVDVTIPIRRMGLTTIDHVKITSSEAAKATIRKGLHVAEGQRFSETALEQTKGHLAGLGLFRRVDISVQPVPSDTHVTVTIEVDEW